MLKNYFKVTWRSIQKNKLYSFVNIVGLTVGITSCILIGLFIWNELSYDRFHSRGERIARVTMEYSSSGTVNKTAVTGTKVGPQFQRVFPQVKAFTRMIKANKSVANGLKVFDEKNILYADADFFQMFSFKILRGNASAVLNSANKIVLTEATAKKYFGQDDPIGKTLRFNGDQDFEVTGIVSTPPINSQVQFEMIASFSSLGASKTEEWWSANYITYVLLSDGRQVPQLQSQVAKYMATVSKTELHMSGSDYLTYNLEPLTSVHLYSQLDGLEPNGNITYIYVLGIIAILILLIACVNYTNLATAQSAGRSTEIGIRKVLGAGKKELFRQFIGEAFILTLIALILALVASVSLLPLFNSITGKEFTASLLLQPIPLISLFVLGIFISLLAGFYPAIILTNSGLISILKSGLRVSSTGGGIRKTLIVFQFVISVFLIVSTIVIVQQISYIQHKDLGYDKDHVLVLPVDYKMRSGYAALKNAVALNPGVVSVSGAYEDPTFVEWGDGINAETEHGHKSLSVTAMPVDLDFVNTMGMHIIAGSDFTKADFISQDTSNNYTNYRTSFILNEKAVKELGWSPADAIGKTIERSVPGTIKAVIKDFNFSSMHEPIGPLVIFLDSSMVRQMFVKVRGDQIASTLSGLEKTWKERVSYRPFSYHFMEEDFAALYSTEQRTAKLFTLFSGLAIALACLGLFALAAFTTVQRTKEIGIRKVLGARIGNIALLVSKEFLMLVLIAIVIASPLAWFASNQWLQNFAYRIDVTWWMFAIAGLIAILIAFGTVSYHAIKAGFANPVKSLRTE
jgi:putative ABC transport system permease protein